jgi:hypothetical protein
VVVLELLQEAQDQLQSIRTPILDELAVPTVSINGGFDGPRQACVLTMASKNADAVIHYTTDGSDPTESSPRYDAELSFSVPTAVAARAFRKGLASENVARVEVYPSLSSGRPVTLAHPFSDRYPAGGPGALVDGLKGSRDFKDGFWQGYEGSDLVATIDLGQARNISRVRSRFVQDTPMWVFYPRSVEYAVSDDGVSFRPVGTTAQPLAESHQDLSMREFDNHVKDVKARYVRVRATSIGVCPPWHAGAGGKAWLFCDEITVE